MTTWCHKDFTPTGSGLKSDSHSNLHFQIDHEREPAFAPGAVLPSNTAVATYKCFAWSG